MKTRPWQTGFGGWMIACTSTVSPGTWQHRTMHVATHRPRVSQSGGDPAPPIRAAFRTAGSDHRPWPDLDACGAPSGGRNCHVERRSTRSITM